MVLILSYPPEADINLVLSRLAGTVVRRDLVLLKHKIAVHGFHNTIRSDSNLLATFTKKGCYGTSAQS